MPEQENEQMHIKIHNFIISGLIAVESARIERKISDGEFAANNFLRPWIKKAIKQKRFHRDLADLLQRFINKNNPNQKLRADFYSIYNEYRAMRLSNTVFEKSEVYRLNEALDSTEKLGFNVQRLLDYNPDDSGSYEPETDREVFILKRDYQLSVNEAKLTGPLNIYVVGDRQEIIDLLYSHGFLMEIAGESNVQAYSHLRIYPHNKFDGAVGIPTSLL